MSFRVALMAVFLFAPAAGGAESGSYAIGRAREIFVDTSRPTKASPPFPGSADRRLETWIWYPAVAAKSDLDADAAVAQGGPWPLVVYSHGTYSTPDSASHLLEHIIDEGVVGIDAKRFRQLPEGTLGSVRPCHFHLRGPSL